MGRCVGRGLGAGVAEGQEGKWGDDFKGEGGIREGYGGREGGRDRGREGRREGGNLQKELGLDQGQRGRGICTLGGGLGGRGIGDRQEEWDLLPVYK